MTVLFFILFLVLSILSEYIARILAACRKSKV